MTTRIITESLKKNFFYTELEELRIYEYHLSWTAGKGGSAWTVIPGFRENTFVKNLKLTKKNITIFSGR